MRTSERFFSTFADTYDLGNHIMSFGIDIYWRRELVRRAAPGTGARILDVCTGTGDVALEFCKTHPTCSVDAMDWSEEMLAIARTKREKAWLDRQCSLFKGDALALPFRDATYDVVTNAFSLRLLGDYARAIQEMHRVAKQGAKIMVLEFSLPDNRAIRAIYRIHLDYALPLVRRLFGELEQYHYLRQSILTFAQNTTIPGLMRDAGLVDVTVEKLTAGTAVLYSGIKA